MLDIAPGSILQRLHLKSRLKKFNKRPAFFIEIGSGKGYMSHIFLQEGHHGIGFDLNKQSCEFNQKLNKEYISKNQYEVCNENFLEANLTQKADIIFSCMVLEHLNEKDVKKYFSQCEKLLNTDGIIMVIVPAAMRYWGIEDEIAGHLKRYEYKCFSALAKQHHLYIQHIAGLTYPISNVLYRLSNYLVQRNEQKAKNLSLQERTIYSGFRQVKFKTVFPRWVKIIFNEITLYPFHLLQKLFSKNKNCMVIFCEMKVAK